MSDNKRIVIVDDRLWKSIGRDVVSIGALTGAVGLGVILESSAMQWVAGILWILVMIGKAAKIEKTNMTIAEARAKLDELEAE